MLTSREARELAQEIAALRRDLEALQRSPQLGRSSIEAGALRVYDETGTLRVQIGLQDDGTYGTKTF